ncbi:MAG: aminopeptidase P family protein [Gemmatimonadaceae bacterium]|nr:aminopeptidase P family protein [Gemmatimonadaceae bacterium]
MSHLPVFPVFPALVAAATLVAGVASTASAQASGDSLRPLGTLREQAALQQQWLARRLETVVPALMRKHGVDMWVIPMREYAEDPVFTSLVSPTTFAARRRTIYVFHDRCAVASPAPSCDVERIALGGTSQGGVYQALSSDRVPDGPAGGQARAQAELWGDEQWQALRRLVESRDPRVIAVNTSRVTAFSDGITAGELDALRESLGDALARRIRPAEALPLELIATRLPEEEATFERMNAIAWDIIAEAFSSRVVTPGVTRTDDVVWWMRQRLVELGLDTWFQPSVSVQRRGMTDQQVGANPVIERGDVLHCDFGVTALRLNTDTQHMGYVLRDGETEAPAGLRGALARSNRLQDIVVEELKVGRTGNEVLAASLARMRAEGIDGTVYSHPVGLHGHGAGPLIGRWDAQDGVPGRGDAYVLPSMWFSIELQATTPVPEWNGQRVRSAQEEDVIIGGEGLVRWAKGRQTDFHLVR